MLSTQRGPFSPPRNLLSNPFNCNCHLAWLGKWLRKRRIVSGNPRCQKPFFLKEIPIQDVAIQDFTCDGEDAWGQGRARQGSEEKREARAGVTAGQDPLNLSLLCPRRAAGAPKDSAGLLAGPHSSIMQIKNSSS